MLNVAIYFRYSSSIERQKLNSEKRQRVELLELALNKGWNIVWNNGDKETSGDETKPKLEELKKEVKERRIKVDIVLVSSFDRLTRKDSLEYSEDVAWIRTAGAKLCILEKGAELIDLNDNQRLLLLQMEVYAANQYLKDLASKTVSGQVARFKRGELGFSNVPFGFERDGKSIKANSDMEYVIKIFKRFCETETISDCIDILKKSNRYGNGEKGVNPSTIKRILRLPLYIGKRTWGVESEGKHCSAKGIATGFGKFENRIVEATETIDTSNTIGKFVDEELFFKANKILDRNKELFNSGKRSKDKRSKYRYSAMLRCQCGRKMVGATTNKGWKYYRCPDSKSAFKDCNKTGGKSVSEEDIKNLRQYIRDTLQKDKDFHYKNFVKYVEWLKRKSIASQRDGKTELEELEIKKRKLKTIIEQALTSSGGDVSESVLGLIKQKQMEIAYEEERLQELAEEGDNLNGLFTGSKKLDNSNTQRRLDHIREYAYLAMNRPDDIDNIFNEYFGLLNMLGKDNDLAPVYLGEIEIHFKKGKDNNNRVRNIPKKFIVDIAQMDSRIKTKGINSPVSIHLLVSTSRSNARIVFTRKSPTKKDTQ